jgi:hypothetical protein
MITDLKVGMEGLMNESRGTTTPREMT